jgi:hypothetical protein
MDPRLLFSLFMLTSICMVLTARAEDMTVSTWDVGCEHTMTTNHFDPAPGVSVEINAPELCKPAPDKHRVPAGKGCR